ncbi:unnamed protein product [Plasmodium vivax]|uniref:(malaria parasite P. vivax) hypothetical protein n=1 Tax=Plasmodium vivax TaxID=5855 RepID=A0A8S4H873_PLAVI|nr:unnamed protein product [Plasmodium vivax]
MENPNESLEKCKKRIYETLYYKSSKSCAYNIAAVEPESSENRGDSQSKIKQCCCKKSCCKKKENDESDVDYNQFMMGPDGQMYSQMYQGQMMQPLMIPTGMMYPQMYPQMYYQQMYQGS